MLTVTRIALLLATVGFAGCAAVAIVRLAPGTSTEADVRAALGEPARVFKEAGGGRQMAFPQGPEGLETYMAYVSPDGRLVRFEQVLKEEQFDRITTGETTQEELERLIGPPWRTMDFPNKRQVAWDYVYRDTWNYTVDLSVMFDERGIVAERIAVRRLPGDRGVSR